MEDRKQFLGIRLDTCFNRTSIMGEPQYRTYCKKNSTIPAIRPVEKGISLNGIGRGLLGIVLIRIYIPFTEMFLTINV